MLFVVLYYVERILVHRDKAPICIFTAAPLPSVSCLLSAPTTGQTCPAAGSGDKITILQHNSLRRTRSPVPGRIGSRGNPAHVLATGRARRGSLPSIHGYQIHQVILGGRTRWRLALPGLAGRAHLSSPQVVTRCDCRADADLHLLSKRKPPRGAFTDKVVWIVGASQVAAAAATLLHAACICICQAGEHPTTAKRLQLFPDHGGAC